MIGAPRAAPSIELFEGCVSDLLGSALCVELEAPLRQGAPPRDDGGPVDVLGAADFALACVVRGPQPQNVPTAALLGDVELTLAPDALLLDYLYGGVVLQAEAADLTICPPHWCPPLPDLAAASAQVDGAAKAAQRALEAAVAAEAGAEVALNLSQSATE